MRSIKIMLTKNVSSLYGAKFLMQFKQISLDNRIVSGKYQISTPKTIRGEKKVGQPVHKYFTKYDDQKIAALDLCHYYRTVALGMTNLHCMHNDNRSSVNVL